MPEPQASQEQSEVQFPSDDFPARKTRILLTADAYKQLLPIASLVLRAIPEGDLKATSSTIGDEKITSAECHGFQFEIDDLLID